MKQYSLFAPAPLYYGGELALGKRKTSRPLARKRPIHLVLKANAHLLRHEGLIAREAKRLAEKFSCRICGCAVAPDHVHLIITIPGRAEYKAFIRSLTGLLARKIKRGLFALIPFTRIANWGKDYLQLKSYFKKNREEARGERPYEPRKDWYRKHRKRP